MPWHPSMGRRCKCEYKDCDALATHFTLGGLFGTVSHCHFHSLRCIQEGYATNQRTISNASR